MIAKKNQLKSKEHSPEIKDALIRALGVQTRDMCLRVLRFDGTALQYIHKQTEEFCAVAVKENPSAREFARFNKTNKCLDINL